MRIGAAKIPHLLPHVGGAAPKYNVFLILPHLPALLRTYSPKKLGKTKNRERSVESMWETSYFGAAPPTMRRQTRIFAAPIHAVIDFGAAELKS